MRNTLKKILAVVLISTICMPSFIPINAEQLRIRGDNDVVHVVEQIDIEDIMTKEDGIFKRGFSTSLFLKVQSKIIETAINIFNRYENTILSMPECYSIEDYKALFDSTFPHDDSHLNFCIFHFNIFATLLMRIINHNINTINAISRRGRQRNFEDCQNTLKLIDDPHNLRYLHFIFLVYFRYLHTYNDINPRKRKAFSHSYKNDTIERFHKIHIDQLPFPETQTEPPKAKLDNIYTEPKPIPIKLPPLYIGFPRLILKL